MILPKPFTPRLNRSLPISKGMVGAYTCSEGGGLTLRDQHSKANGVITGASWDRGLYGYDLDFSSNAHDVQITSKPQIDNIFAGGGTIATVIRIRALGAAGSPNGRIASKNDAAGWIFYVGDTGPTGSGDLLFLQDFSGGVAFWSQNNVFPSFASIHKVAVTYDSSSTSNVPIFYVDDVAYNPTEGAAPSGTAESDAGTDLYLGNNAAGTRGSQAAMFGINFWDRILTRNELTKWNAEPFKMYRHKRYGVGKSSAAVTGPPVGTLSMMGVGR